MKTHLSGRLGFTWRLFWILCTAAIVGILAIVPAAIELFGPKLSQTPLPLPLPIIILLGAIQNLVLLGLFVGIGLKLSGQLGLGSSLIRPWLDKTLTFDQTRRAFLHGVLAGFALGIVLVSVVLVLSRYLPNLPFVTAARIPIWKRFLMCFYGGFYEEIFSRLFLLSLVAWLINRSWRNNSKPLTSWSFWSANAIVALLFGLGHLPNASLLMPITPLVVIAALFLNGLAALVFGWLYRRRGLEAAMIAHFTTDFLLWVVGPVFLKNSG
jgi:membrane protease YdiL (CAAX protease family)